MCPMCLATALLVVAKVAGLGGAAALARKALGRRKAPDEIPDPAQPRTILNPNPETEHST